MGRCIICGASTDGRVCGTHEEDVGFEFRGTKPDQLVTDRYYEGTVDGYADFGVFVDIGDHVTGLLHQSEIDQRLESLDWEPGDTVYVQVLRVRDNGDVDLGWSIRQSERDFRGNLIHDPGEGDLLPEDDESDDAETADESSGGGSPGRGRSESAAATDGPSETDGGPSTDVETETGGDAGSSLETDSDDSGTDSTSDGAGFEPADTPGSETVEAERIAEAPVRTDDGADATEASDDDPSEAVVDEGDEQAYDEASDAERVAIGSLDDHVGDRIAIEGEVVGIRQTGGPTIFEVRDETATVDVAAFAGAGERAHANVETEDVVRIVGEVELRRDEIQVERESLTLLAGDGADAVRGRMDAALHDRAEPEAREPLADHDAVAALDDDLIEVATEIRRAIFDSRPVILRHTATAGGYVAGAAIERAVLPLVREEHTRSDAEYHFFDRKPLEGPVYEMEDATTDVSNMLEAHERHDEPLPLVVLVGAGSTVESLDALELLSVYDVDQLVVDADDGDADVAEEVETMVNPALAGVENGLTTTTLAANLALHVNADVREDLRHLPAVSYWEDVPEAYRELAREAGYDETATRELREALALAAFYQTYEDKRQLVTDLLFGGAPAEGDARGLAAHVSEQFREKLEGAIQTARANAETRQAGGVRFTVLDAEAFTDQYEFPPTELLVDVLHRREHDEAETQVTLVITTDELHLRSDERLDVRAVASQVADRTTDAGVRSVGGRHGRIEFVAGEREPVLKSTVQAVADLL